MKTNKKAIFGFAVAMIFSLAIMQGISTKNSKEDVSMQQITVGCGYMAGSSEGGASGAWNAASNIGAGVTAGLFYGSLTYTWNPLGWVGYATTIASAL